MTAQSKIILHGTAVALAAPGGALSAVLLRGKSGSGKSDLAFRLIETGAVLVSDDQVAMERRGDGITAGAPEAIRGLLEVRGVGLLKYPPAPSAPLRLVVDLVAREDVPRLPNAERITILGMALPYLHLHAFDVSTPLKITRAMELAEAPGLLYDGKKQGG